MIGSKDSNWVDMVNESGKANLTRLNEIIWKRKRKEQVRKEEISDSWKVERREQGDDKNSVNRI